ncbi:MAG: hypothetical protein AB4058_07210 [Microcystaceae cyanobacterium]
MVESGKVTPRYEVTVIAQSGELVKAYLEEARQEDLLNLYQEDWTFNWLGFWHNTDFDCEGIIKLSYQEKILGLIRFGLYPYPYLNNVIEYLEILHLEGIQRQQRLVKPVGFWLIWYVTKIALKYCGGGTMEEIVVLDSVEEAMSYYQDKVKMESIGWTTIAPGEEGYAFKFTRSTAQQFCTRIETRYGIPRNVG